MDVEPPAARIAIRVTPPLLCDTLAIALRARAMDAEVHATVGADHGGTLGARWPVGGALDDERGFDLEVVSEGFTVDTCEALADTIVVLDGAGTACCVRRAGHDLEVHHRVRGLADIVGLVEELLAVPLREPG